MEDSEKRRDLVNLMNSMVGGDFVVAARMLREAQDEFPDKFAQVAKDLGIGKRKAYALAQINRTFDDLGVPWERLRQIGWTKLMIIAPYAGEDSLDGLLDLAEACTAHELSRHLHGEPVFADEHCVILYLSNEQYQVFEQALVGHGALRSTRGMAGKEAALTKALERLLTKF